MRKTLLLFSFLCCLLAGGAVGQTITSFTPLSAKPGDAVTITGTGFNTTLANNIVFFGATKATLTAATATSITATVPTGATYAPITVLNTVLVKMASSRANFNPIYAPAKTTITATDFPAKIDFTTGTKPYSVAIGDLDGDGKPDLAVANQTSNTVSVYRNTSSSGSIAAGSFAAKIDFATGGDPKSVSIGDLDGDGKPDLAVANSFSATVSVFRNTSSSGSIDASSFAAKIDFPTGSAPVSVAIGDLDGDGKPDLAVVNAGSDNVSVLRNTSSAGSVTFATKIDFITGTNTRSVAIGDLDGDGKLDLAVANSGAATVSVLRNTSSAGSVTFAAKTDFITGDVPFSVAIGDLDGDGKPDLAVANIGSNTVSVFRNTSTSGSIAASSFTAKTDFTSGTSPYSVAIGDLDGDGKPDLAVANKNSNTVSVFRNTSSSGSITTSSFAVKIDFITGDAPYSVVIGDLDGDGKPDLAVANYNSSTVSVLRNADIVVPTITSFTPLSAKPGDVVTITGTGFNNTAANNIVFFGATRATPTLATATSITATVPTGATYAPITVLNTTLVKMASSGVNFNPIYAPAKTSITASDFLAKIDLTTGTNPQLVAIGDLDGDGKPDLAVANYGSATVSVFRNTSSSGSIAAGSFAAKIDFTTGTNPRSVAIGDLDGDGKPDLAVANNGSATVSVFRNTSTSGSIDASSFAAKTDFATGGSPTSVAIGDLDGDGKPDLAVANRSLATVSVLRNTSTSGTSSFATKIDFATGSSPQSVAIGDLDGDGKPDLAVANEGSNTVSVLRNTSSAGSIIFGVKTDFTTETNPFSVAIGDLDGDGKPDLAVATYVSNTVSVLRNTSTSGSIVASSFAAKIDFPTGSFPFSVAIGDLDGDGKPDLAVANGGGSAVSVLRNTSSSGSIVASSFAAKIDFSTGNNPQSVVIGDLDGDGKPDLAVANYSSNTVSVLRNADIVVPTITSFTPLSAKPGDAVTITGTGFNTTAANNIVFFGATKATLTAATATSITATVPTGATYAPITVLNTTLVKMASSGVNFNPIYAPAKTSITATDFLAKIDFSTGSDSNPVSVAIGDLDGDGKPDLAVANRGESTVSVYRNISSSGSIAASSFAAKIDFPTGGRPVSVAIGDLDGDGKPDLAVANYVSHIVSVFRNTSTSGSITASSFADKIDFTTGRFPKSVAIGDLDGDGKPDLAVANTSPATVSVLRNTSSSGTIGASSFAPQISFTTGTDPSSVAIGDLDGDGKPDLAVANFTSATVSVFRNTSTSGSIAGSSFADKIDFTTGTGPESVAIGDLDGDGKPDLAVANFNSSSVSVFRNTSTSGSIAGSSFADKIDFPTGGFTTSVGIGDLDGDGKPDLATTSGRLLVFRNTSSSGSIVAGSFAAKIEFTTGTSPYSVAIGDLDGDGKPDLAMVNYISNTVSVFRNADIVFPTITSFTPLSAKPGDVVTITGTGFNTTVANNIVFFGATKATLTAATATSITATVPTGATYAPISVLNTTTVLSASSGANFNPIYAPAKTSITATDFLAKIDFTTGIYPRSVAIGDLDGDGKPDLAVANDGSNTVSIYRNTSSSGSIAASSFAAKIDFITGTSPRSIAIGDLDGDGKPDLAVANYYSATVSVFRNTGSSGGIDASSFTAKIDFTTGTSGTYPRSVAIGDLDGDGKPDLAVANDISNTVSVFRNTSTSGTIAASSFAAKIDFATGSSPLSVAIGDLDGDGKPDLAVANKSSNTVSVFRNTSSSGSIGTSSFAAKTDFTTGTQPLSVAIGDLDGDGKPDLAVANQASNTVSVFRNTGSSGSIGNSSFAAKTDFTTGSLPQSAAIGDLDGDGKPDLAMASYDQSTVSVIRNTSISGSITASSFAAKIDFATGNTPQSVAIGDLDGDGKLDLALANYNSYTVSVLRNADIVVPTITSFTPLSAKPGDAVTITGTGFNTTLASNIVFFGATKATLTAATATSITATVPAGATYAPLTVLNTALAKMASSRANFNPIYAPAKISITATDFLAKIDFTTGTQTQPQSVAIGDLDGDGKPDLAVANNGSATVSVFRNTSSSGSIAAGSFTTKTDFATGTNPTSVAIGDLDGDGKPDLAVANSNSNTVSVLRNTGSSGSIAASSFAAKIDFATESGSGPYSVAIGDLDGDGKPDLAVTNATSNNVSVFRNTSSSGNSSFATKIDFITGTSPQSVAIGDLDGDGKPDLAVANFGSATVSVFRNTSSSGSIGTGSFAAKTDFTTGTSPFAVAIGDLDGDGKPDLAVANIGSNTVSVFRNTSTSGSIGTGSFAAKTDFTTGTSPFAVAIGDLDGDGKPDLAVANYGSSTVSVFRNTGTSGSIAASSFAAKIDFITGTNPFSVAIGDLDGDGKPDLAVANYFSNTVSVLRNADIVVPTITSFTPLSAKPGDVVTITGTGFNTTAANNIVFFGATKATLTAATATSITATVPTGATYAPITVLNTALVKMASSRANFNPIYSPAKTSITATDFLSKIDFTTGTSPRSVAIGDLDGDGKPDLAVANANSATVSVYRNTSSSGTIAASSFTTKTDFTTGTSPFSVAISDLDGDGKPDLAVANIGSNTVSVFRNTSTSGSIDANSFTAKIDFPAGTLPMSVAIGDLDGDGKPDLAVANYGSSTVSVFRNISTSGTIAASSFAAKIDINTGTEPRSVVIGDMDGDGKPDLAVTNSGSATVSVFRNTGSSGSIGTSSFAAKTDFTTGTNPYSVAIGDLDGDGKPDLSVANYGSSTVSVFRNTSTSGSIAANSFAAKTDFTTGTNPFSVAIGDLDGDGKPDLAVANYQSATVSVFRNTSTSGSIAASSFAAKIDFITGTSPHSVAIGDLDGDGKPDLAVANSNSNTVSVLRNADIVVPTITSFTPLSAKPGDAVTITGTGFNTTAANNIVFFGATKAILTAATATSITATVPTGATYAPITVLNTALVTMASSRANFNPIYVPAKTSITATDFLAKIDFTTGTEPLSVAIGDLDGDGKPDLAVANKSLHTVSVFHNTSSSGSIAAGSFTTKTDFTTGFGPVSVAIGDLDGDGKPDLAVANLFPNTVSVLRNTSTSGSITTSSFTAKTDFTTGNIPISVAIGDLDGDGKPDLIVANSSATVSVLRNTSTTGSIAASSFAAKIDFATGSSPTSVAIGDLDGDGKLDLAVANSGPNSVSVFRNTGSSGSITTSSFAAKTDFTTGTSPFAVAIGDLDGDGKPDLAVVNYSSNNVSVFRNTSTSGSIVTGSFATKIDFATGTNPRSVVIGDLDGDGKPDLAVANQTSNTVSVFRNTSSSGSIAASSFAAKIDFTTGTEPYSVAIGDLDGDGKPDLAVANLFSNTVSVLRNAGVITVTGTPTAFTACSGTASTEQNFTVSGIHLTANLIITAPTGFEVSTTSGSGFGSSVTLTPSVGSVTGTTIYVRIAATATGSPIGHITVASTGATNKTVAVSGTVSALPTLALGPIPAINAGAMSFTLPYTNSTGSPTIYSISGTGITGVQDGALPTSLITVNLSAPASGSSISFNLTVKNAVGCVSANIPGSVTVNTGLTLGTVTNPTTCGGTGSIAFTSSSITAGSQTLNYKKDNVNATANVTIANDGTFTLAALGAGLYSDFAIGATTATGNRRLSDPTFTLTVGTPTNATTCEGNGSIAFTTTLPGGSYTLTYKKGSASQTATVTVNSPVQAGGTGSSTPSNSFVLSNLTAGTYNAFKIVHASCDVTAAGPVELSGPVCVHVIYVNASNSAPAQDGNSWATAFRSLQSGLSEAALPSTVPVEVWVANGTYKPGNTRESYFNIPSGVKVYGGFVGNESQLAQRVISPSGGQGAFLSGEISTSAHFDNTRHVAVFQNTNAGTLLDGFTITRGYADFFPTTANVNTPDLMSAGGGVLALDQAQGTIANCTISGNRAMSGGGIFQQGNSRVNVQQSVIWGNEATFGGGFYHLSKSSPTYTNCLIVQNKAMGGAGYNNNSTPTFMNCTIASNQGNDGTTGGIANTNQSSSTFTNSIVWGNSNLQIDAGSVVTYSVVQGGYTGTANISTDPKLVSAPPFGLALISPLGDYRLLVCSPAINAATATGAPAVDIAGSARPQGAGVDIGVHEGPGVIVPPTQSLTANITTGTVLIIAGTITATNQVANANVEYRAGSSVTLLPGFQATGNTFQATIGTSGCN